MKTIKNLLVIITLVIISVSTAYAQLRQSGSYGEAQASPYEFRTTSTMTGSGSALPNAASNGVVFSGNTPGEYSSGSAYGPRRIGGSGSGTGGNEAEESHDPQETPVGDGMWVMMLMAVGYLIYRVRTRKREVTA